MQQVSATYTSLLQSNHSVESKLEVWDKDGANLVHTFEETEIFSMSTTRGLFANGAPSVGGTVSCEIDCTLYTTKEPSIEEGSGTSWVFGPFAPEYVIYDSVQIVNNEIVGVNEIFRGYPEPGTEYRGKYTQPLSGWVKINEIVSGGGNGTAINLSQITPDIPRMAMLKPYIRLVSLLYQWQKWSIAGTYHWKKYAVDVNYTDRSIGNTGTKNYSHVGTPETMVINSTPQIVVIDGEPKYDFSSGRQTVVQTDYTPVGSFCAANAGSIKTASGGVGNYQTYYAKVLSIKDNSVFGWIASSDANSEIHDIQTTRSRGTYIEDVSSTNQSSYPQNGEQGGYWYVYDGYTQERGSYIENVSSDNQSAYPQNGIQDGYWYVSMGKPVSEWLPKGVYWIDTRSADYSSGKMTIHGYDAMLKGETQFANEKTVADWSRTDLQVLNGYYSGTTLVHNGIAQKLGVTIQQDSLDLINKGYEIQFPGTVQGDDENVQGAAYTVRECLSYIMAMYGLNATIDEDGTMRFVPLTAQTVETTLAKNVMSFDTIPAFEAFGQVEVIVNESERIVYPATKPTGKRTLTVTSPWGLQDLDDRTLVAENILSVVQNYAHQPFNADGAILDPAAQLGDGVSVNGVTSVLNAIGTRFSSLCSANISAPQDEEIDHEYPYESKENREIARSIASTKASLTVLSDNIESKVSSDEAQSLINQTLEEISLSVCGTTGTTTFTLKQGEAELSTTTFDLHVSSVNVEGTITADAIDLSTATISGQLTATNINAGTMDVGTLLINGKSIGGNMSNNRLNSIYSLTATFNQADINSRIRFYDEGSQSYPIYLGASGVHQGGTWHSWSSIISGGSAVWG